MHDFIILWASIRRGGRSLAEIARIEIGPVAGVTTGIAILFIIVIALAGLGLVVVNALSESPWGTFTIGATIPLALFMGFYMYRFRQGQITEATIIGVIGLMAAVIFGKPLAATAFGQYFDAHPRAARHRDGGLRVHRLGAAGLDAARAARLPQLVHEDRDHRACWSSASSSSTPSCTCRP